MYIYPDNLKGKSTLFLWPLRDLLVIIIGAIIGVTIAATLHFLLPAVLVGVYAFLTLRIDDELNIADYVRFAFRFFITTQQLFYWGWDD